jgi:hypothetical protein
VWDKENWSGIKKEGIKKEGGGEGRKKERKKDCLLTQHSI